MRSRLPLRLETSTLTRPPPSTRSTSVRPTNFSTSPTSSVQRRSSTGVIGAVATADVGITAAGVGAGAPGGDALTAVRGAADDADALVSAGGTGAGVAGTTGAAGVASGAGAGATGAGAGGAGAGGADAGATAAGAAGAGEVTAALPVAGPDGAVGGAIGAGPAATGGGVAAGDAAAGAGRAPWRCASAASAVVPIPRPTAVTSCALRPSMPSTATRAPAAGVPSRRADATPT